MLAWLECKRLHDGMFENEIAVEAQNSKGETFTLFTDKRTLREEEGKCYLKVTLLKEGKEHSLIVLPADSYELRTKIVQVPTVKLKQG